MYEPAGSAHGVYGDLRNPVQWCGRRGACDVPLKYETIGRAFDETARRFARRDALIVPAQQVRWSYEELQNLASALSREA